MIKAIADSAAYLVKKGIVHAPEFGVVLGTGLGNLVEKIQVKLTIPYHDIPGFPASTVEFHKGQVVYGTIGNIHVIALQGRFHYCGSNSKTPHQVSLFFQSQLNRT